MRLVAISLGLVVPVLLYLFRHDLYVLEHIFKVGEVNPINSTLSSVFWVEKSLFGAALILGGLVLFAYITLIYLIPSYYLCYVIWNAAVELRKKYDIVGIERTLKEVHMMIMKRTKNKYKEFKEKLFIKSLPSIIGNIVLTVLTMWLIFNFESIVMCLTEIIRG